MTPATTFDNAAHLSNGHAKLLSERPLRSARTIGNRTSDIRYLLARKFGGDAFLANLSCSMPEHVALIFAVCSPPEIANRIVAWATIIVRNIGLPRLWRIKESYRYSPVRGNGFPNPVIAPQNKSYVPSLVGRADDFNWLISNRVAWISPLSGLSPPCPKATASRRFVMGKPRNLPPLFEVLHGW